MMTSDPFITLLAGMSMTVALLGAVLSLTQGQGRVLSRVLACFFLSVAITELNDALGPSIPHEPVLMVLNAIWIIGAASAMPLLWLYIWVLTEPEPKWPEQVWPHAITPAIACLLCALLFTLSQTDRRTLLTDAGGEISGMAFAVGAMFETFALFIITLQWGGYLVLSAKRLFLYRARLKDVFASTEGKELRWVAMIIAVGGTYWLYGIVLLVLDLIGANPDRPESPEYILNLLVSCILVIWGLRQRGALHHSAPENTLAEPAKYAKSALTADMAKRIAAKLKRAMCDDHLHLDPNLSLWALSRHIGVSDNYVSQVLNEEIGQNFFDFVNGYRVTEAKERLIRTDDTILSIAYEIGFNSRSSFYTAFRKSTGQTPTAFRKNTVRAG